MEKNAISKKIELGQTVKTIFWYLDKDTFKNSKTIIAQISKKIFFFMKKMQYLKRLNWAKLSNKVFGIWTKTHSKIQKKVV